jgi:hypothetical protein
MLGCAATLTSLGKQLLTGCVSNIVTGPDQSVAVSWLSTEFASGLPVPTSGQGVVNRDVGPYHLGIAWTNTGCNLVISVRSG